MKAPMPADRWRRVEEIFYAVISSEKEKYSEILAQECGDDVDLRYEIESLLEFDTEASSTKFLDQPINIKYEENAEEALALVGRVFDEKYQINKQLGQGGTATVYLATHLWTKRLVAIKVIAHKYLVDNKEEILDRFKQEAQFAGSLRHPNIVNVTDFGFVEVDRQQIAYLVMEYLDGYTLGTLIREKGKLSLSLTLDITEQICLALAEAHSKAIIHRDLKPENIWLEPDRRGGYNVKVLDFGLATLLDTLTSDLEKASSHNKIIQFPVPKQSLPSIDLQLYNTVEIKPSITHNDSVLGTPRYMSPEQCSGKKLDITTDIYSLATIVYQMITGETPFDGSSRLLLKKQVESQPPSIKERCQNIPTDLAELIMSALSKKTAERPATAASFAIALRLAVEGDKPLLNQADLIYRENRLKFLTIATLIYSPIIAVNIFLLMLSHWLIFLYLPIILFANNLNNAFCSMAVNRLLNDRSFQIKPLLVSLIKKIGAISSTSITMGLKSLTKPNFFSLQPYAKYILHVPITTLEGESKNRALYHSTVLSRRISAIVSSLLFYEITLALITIAMTQLLMWWFYWSHNATLTSLLSQGTGLIFTLAPVYLCPLIMSIGYSFYAIANTIIYFKAKQINNEITNKESLLSLSDAAATSSREIKLQYLLVLIFKALVTFTAIVCITALVAVVAHKLGLPTGSFKIE